MKKLLILFIILLAGCSMVAPASVAALVHNDPSTITDQCDKSNKNVDCIPQCNDPSIGPVSTDPKSGCPQTGCTDENCDIIGKYVNPFIKFLGFALGIAVTVGIIWGGIEYSSSGGDPQKAASGKRHITVAIVALISYFFLYGLLNFLIPGGI